ncbi:hypothetical protein GF314_06645, partial [bacterium]|nr:hypothetical protein [bacterium]
MPLRQRLAAIVVIVAVVPVATAYAGDFGSRRREPAFHSLSLALDRLAPGDTLSWLGPSGSSGRLVLAHVDSGRTLRGDRGAVVAADSLAALWRREPDKTAPFSRRLG